MRFLQLLQVQGEGVQEGDGGGDGCGGGGALQAGAQGERQGGREEEECCGVAVQVGGTVAPSLHSPTCPSRICHNSGRRLAGEAAALAHAAAHGQEGAVGAAT